MSLRTAVRAAGRRSLAVLGLYALGKFALTFLRTEMVWLWGLQEAQLVALGMLVVAIAWGRCAARVASRHDTRLSAS
jgi:hypothetical protein